MDFEVDGQGVFDSNGYAVLSAWSPSRHTLDEKYGFSIEERITSRFGYCRTTDTAIGIDDKLTNSSALDAIVLDTLRVVQVIFNVLEQCVSSSRKFGHLFNEGVDLAIILIVFSVSGFVNRQA